MDAHLQLSQRCRPVPSAAHPAAAHAHSPHTHMQAHVCTQTRMSAPAQTCSDVDTTWQQGGRGAPSCSASDPRAWPCPWAFLGLRLPIRGLRVLGHSQAKDRGWGVAVPWGREAGGGGGDSEVGRPSPHSRF